MLGLWTRLLLALVAGTVGLAAVPAHGRLVGLLVAVGLVLVGRVILTACRMMDEQEAEDSR